MVDEFMDHKLQVASGKWQVTSGKWQEAGFVVHEWTIASGRGQVACDKWQVASGKWHHTFNQCSLSMNICM